MRASRLRLRFHQIKLFMLKRLYGLRLRLRQRLGLRANLLPLFLLLGFCLGYLPHVLLVRHAAAAQVRSSSASQSQNLGLSSTSAQTAKQAEQQGNLLYQQAEYSSALLRWQEALERYRQENNGLGQARVLSNLSLAYQALGHWTAAETAIARSLELAQASPPAILAQALNTQGQLYLARGQASKALESWTLAERAYEQADDQAGLVRSQLNQIQALRSLGFYRRALDQLAALEPQLSALPETPLKLAALTQAGELLRLAGDTDQAQARLEAAVEMGDRASQSAVSQALMNLGALAQTRRQPAEAAAYYDRALEQATSLASRCQTQLAMLSLWVQQKNVAEAQALWPQIQAELETLPVSHYASYQRIGLAKLLMELKALDNVVGNNVVGNVEPNAGPSWTATNALLRQTAAEAQTLQDLRSESHARGNLAQAYRKQNRLEEAEAQVNQAILLAQSLSAKDMLYRWQWTLSQIQMQQGQIETAIANCSEAVATLQGLQGDLVALNPDVLFSFDRDIEPIYRGYVDMLLQADSGVARDKQQTLREVQTLSQDYLSQAQNAARSLRLAEMTNFLGEDCLQASPGQTVAVGQIDPTAAVIHPIVLKDRLEILLNLPNQSMQHFAVPVPQADVESLIKELRYYLVVRSRRRYLPLSQQLYDWIIRPLEQELAGIETLVFSPDGLFQGIPMAALHDGNQFLIERYQVALSPGLGLFEPKALDNPQISVLAAGLSEARQGFSALPFVTDEIESIQRNIAATTALVDENFTRAALRDRVATSQAPIVHIATHGQFGSRPEDTFILAWDQSVNVRQLDQLLQSRTLSQEQAIELLVLSACETAAGDNQAMLGLAGLAIQAGARSTLATLWSVNDAGTSTLMESFYRALAQPGVGRAQALRQAQLEMLDDPAYRHPLYWASYVIVGNWL